MKLEVIIPVGPGHAELARNALESVRICSAYSSAFDQISARVVDDSDGRIGRSAARNQGVRESAADWVFFLDADDMLHPLALREASKYVGEARAIWGNLWEYHAGVASWRYQVPIIETYDQLLSFDPYITLHIGHLIERALAIETPFEEGLDVGEDWGHFLRLWAQHRCIKAEHPQLLNFRGAHSSGPRSATGGQWTEVVGRMLRKAREARWGTEKRMLEIKS